MMDVRVMKSDTELARCFPVFQELRPELKDSKDFIQKISLAQEENYQIVAALVDDTVLACMAMRLMHTLAWGKIVYIDDLITASHTRNKGAASKLMEYAINFAKTNNCEQVHLDSGYHRILAHKFYLNRGFQLSTHHLSLVLNKVK